MSHLSNIPQHTLILILIYFIYSKYSWINTTLPTLLIKKIQARHSSMNYWSQLFRKLSLKITWTCKFEINKLGYLKHFCVHIYVCIHTHLLHKHICPPKENVDCFPKEMVPLKRQWNPVMAAHTFNLGTWKADTRRLLKF